MKSKLQLTALTMGLVLVAASAANAQNLTLPEFLSLGGTGEINQVPQITYPSVDGFTWVDLADYVAPVANFTGFRLNGTAIAPADLIPLRSTSFTLVDPATGVTTPVTGKNIYNSDGTITGTTGQTRTVTQAGNTLAFIGGSLTFAPVGVTNTLQIIPGGTPTNVRLYSGGPLELQSFNNTSQLVLASNGNVGVGTATPTHAKLSVIGSYTGNVGIGAGTYCSVLPTAYTGPGPGVAYPSLPVSIYASSEVISSAGFRGSFLQAINITVSSDGRAKNIIGLTDSAQDLRTLEKIRITDYQLKDTRLQRTESTKKVIAQEVESVYPNAVSKTNDKIPDIMQVATVTLNEGKVQLSLAKDTYLKVGEKIAILDENDTPTVTTIEKIDGTTITVTLADAKAGEKRFVYGHQVDDFRTVDYDALSMLNISATQELSKEVTALKVDNITLKAENAKLTAAVAKLEILEKAVAALEGKANTAVTVSLTK